MERQPCKYDKDGLCVLAPEATVACECDPSCEYYEPKHRPKAG